MIADSTCLAEQLIKDVVAGAFDSAGQRCSATRFLFIQRDNADDVLEMLKGAIKNLVLGFSHDQIQTFRVLLMVLHISVFKNALQY